MPNARRPPKRIVQYPWNEWLDGEVHHLTQGKDFKVGLNIFRGMLYQKAIEKNLLVQIDIWYGPPKLLRDRGYDIRFYPKPRHEDVPIRL